MNIDWAPWIVGISGIIGYFTKTLLDHYKNLSTYNVDKRREIYQEFIDMIIDVIGGQKIEKKKEELNLELRTKVYGFYKKFILYSSAKTINKYGDFMQSIYQGNSNVADLMSKLSDIIKSMREELGLTNEELGGNGEKLLRPIFTDFDSIYKKD